jgi:hypothetical protein
MSNYTKATNFAAKDSLAAGNSLKIVRGTEIDTEFNNIATAIATKIDGTFTNFSLVESSGVLYFKYNGVSVASLDGAGNVTTLGNIVSNGTV